MTSSTVVWEKIDGLDRKVETLLLQMSMEDKVNLVSGKLVVNGNGQHPSLPDGLPELSLADGPAGIRVADLSSGEGRSTALPAPIALAASWNPKLAHQYGDLLGAEATMTGHNVLLAPAVDIARTPYGGRTLESLGEDPLLQARMVVPEIEAIQSHAVVCCVKHYVVNNQEYRRKGLDVQVDERTLHEIYLPPFEAAVRDGHAGALLSTMNKINGTYTNENQFVLSRVLRDWFGFQGFIMSGFKAIHDTVETVRAGLDWELIGDGWGPKLLKAVQAGQVGRDALDEMVRRILRPVLGLGLADHPLEIRPLPVMEHSAQACAIAEQGMVLLKNESELLPFSAETIHSIAIIGPDVENVAIGRGSASVRPAHSVSMVDGIRQRVGADVKVEYAPGTDAIGPGTLLPGLPAIPSEYFAEVGLQVEYWNNPGFAGKPSVTRQESQIELNYGLFDLFPGPNKALPRSPSRPAELDGRISVRFSGQLNVPIEGEYEFSLTCLGTARLHLDGQMLIDSSEAAPETMGLGNNPAKVYITKIQLKAGHAYSLALEYAADAPGEFLFNEAMLRVGWRPPTGVQLSSVQRAAALAARSDVAVVVVRTYESEEMDRPSLSLPNGQVELIRAVAAANARTVVVLMNGGPVETATWEGEVPAILEAWFAGQEQGQAVARVLFGDVNPSGRLPLTFPRSEAEIPLSSPFQYPGVEGKVHYSEGLFVGYRGYEKQELKPQYPFGYGLSYTSFQYFNLQLSPEASDGIQGIRVSFEIANTGPCDGTDVPQVYLGLPKSISAPSKKLVGWERVELRKGERRKVTIVLEPRSLEHLLSYWNSDSKEWEIANGTYRVHLGASERDIRLVTTFRIEGV